MVPPPGFPQSMLGGTVGTGLPPFQTAVGTNPFGQTGTGSALEVQKSSGLFGVENKTTTNTSGGSPFKTSSPGFQSMDYTAGINSRFGQAAFAHRLCKHLCNQGRFYCVPYFPIMCPTFFVVWFVLWLIFQSKLYTLYHLRPQEGTVYTLYNRTLLHPWQITQLIYKGFLRLTNHIHGLALCYMEKARVSLG